MTSSESDNRMVWDRRPGHYEVWYATLSHRPTATGFWIRYTLEAPDAGAPWAELWFARFDPADPSRTFGVHKRFPVEKLRAEDSPFAIALGDAELRHDGMRGALAGEGHEARWSLSWKPAARTLLWMPSWGYRGKLTQSKSLSPNPSVAASGEITVDGRTYQLDGDPLGQSHVWGRKHLYAWGWGHCNAFEDDRAASFEAIAARLKRGSVILPTLTGFTLTLDGEELSFREAWKMPLARAEWRTGHFRVLGSSPDTRVEAVYSCRPEDMLLTEYLDPDGDPAFCHNTCCADLALTVWKRSPFVGRWREHRKLAAHKTGHFEWGGRAGDALSVKKSHALIA